MARRTIAVLGPDGIYLSHCTWIRALGLLESGRAIRLNATTVKLKQTKKERTIKKHSIIADSKRICYICNKQIPDDEIATIDHIVPKSRDRRADSYDNMKCCCSHCNNDKGNMTLSEYVQHILKHRKLYDYISDERLEYLHRFSKCYEKDFYARKYTQDVRPPYKIMYKRRRRQK